MGLCRKVDDYVMVLEGGENLGLVPNVTLHDRETRVMGNGIEIVQVAGIREGIKDCYAINRVAPPAVKQATNVIGTDETCTAGDEVSH
jgi:hypothetical protein